MFNNDYSSEPTQEDEAEEQMLQHHGADIELYNPKQKVAEHDKDSMKYSNYHSR